MNNEELCVKFVDTLKKLQYEAEKYHLSIAELLECVFVFLNVYFRDLSYFSSLSSSQFLMYVYIFRIFNPHSSLDSHRLSAMLFPFLSSRIPHNQIILNLPLLFLSGGFHLNASHDHTTRVFFFSFI